MCTGSENCEICAKKPEPGKYLTCPGVAQHKFCYPCWDAMALKRFFVSGDVFCPVGHICPNSYGKEMPWKSKESEIRTDLMLLKIEADSLKADKLTKRKKTKKEKKREKIVNLETILKKVAELELEMIETEKLKLSDAIYCEEAVSSDLEKHEKPVTSNYKKNKANTVFQDNHPFKKVKEDNDREKMCEDINKLKNKGIEVKNKSTGARPKVKSTIQKSTSHQEKRHISSGWVSHVIDGRQYEIKKEIETVKTANTCEIHAREQVIREALQTFECPSSQALWCKNGNSIGEVMKCGGCMKVAYCSEVCQASDWENHRALRTVQRMEDREKRARS